MQNGSVHAQMFPYAHHRLNIWLNASLHTAACPMDISIHEMLVFTYPFDQLFNLFFFLLNQQWLLAFVLVWLFLRIQNLFNSFLGLSGTEKAQKESQSILVRMSMTTTQPAQRQRVTNTCCRNLWFCIFASSKSALL